MRIAQVAPLFESVPPKLYGGTERVISYLTEELVRLGLEVTLFASGDSETNAKLVPVCPRASWRDQCCRETLPHHVRLLELVFQDASRFDVIHFHCDYLDFPLLRRRPCPSVTTLHGRLHIPDLLPRFAEYAEVPLVSISHEQRRPIPRANWQATVCHGLSRDLYTFREWPGDYLAFLGRISPEKRLDRAIAIAQQSGRKLKVAAKIYPEERDYFTQTIEPLLHESRSWVEFLGEVGGRQKDELLGLALALLFPIDWPEPFGLVMIEAMACGTPVIAWRNGSVPEVMEDDVTGFVVDSVEEAAWAVGRVVLGYRGLDGVRRRTLLQFSPHPSLLTASTARLDWRQPSSGSTAMGIGTATASWSITANRPLGCFIRDGKTPTMPSSTPTVPWPEALLPCARSKAMSMPPVGPGRRWRLFWAAAGRRRNWHSRPRRCGNGLSGPSGVRNCPPTPSPWMGTSDPARCGRPTRGSACSPAS